MSFHLSSVWAHANPLSKGLRIGGVLPNLKRMAGIIPKAPSAEDQEWSTQITSKSRADFVKISSVVTRGLNLEKLNSDGILIGVKGPPVSGKTLILDTVIFDLSKDRNCFKEPPQGQMCLEKRPDEAYKSKVSGVFELAVGEVDIAFRNFGKLRPWPIPFMKKPGEIGMFAYNYDPQGPTFTHNHGEHPAEIASYTGADVIIALSSRNLWNGQWNNDWTIHVAENHRTPEMRMHLDHLASVQTRRLASQTCQPLWSATNSEEDTPAAYEIAACEIA